jgi:membrane-associated phospholipid phosphatase
VLGISASYVFLSLLIGAAVGWRGPVLPKTLVIGAVVCGAGIFVLVFPTYWIVEVARSAKNRIPLRQSIPAGGRRATALTFRLGLRFVTTLFLAILVCSMLEGWRVSIPAIHPFAWDARLDRLDAILHGGVRPWRLAHALMHSAVATDWLPDLVDWTYSKGWFFANIGILLTLPLGPVGPRGQRVLVAYVLQLAILGSVLAVVFSSAGPIYFPAVVAPTHYTALPPSLDVHLHTTGLLTARQYQTYLWTQYRAGNAGLTTGITAFPSLHVSSATLLALALRSWRPWAGLVGWTFVALTLLGSVYLGWHYAVDGYASILGMLGIWWIAGRLSRARWLHANSLEGARSHTPPVGSPTVGAA